MTQSISVSFLKGSKLAAFTKEGKTLTLFYRHLLLIGVVGQTCNRSLSITMLLFTRNDIQYISNTRVDESTQPPSKNQFRYLLFFNQVKLRYLNCRRKHSGNMYYVVHSRIVYTTQTYY